MASATRTESHSSARVPRLVRCRRPRGSRLGAAPAPLAAPRRGGARGGGGALAAEAAAAAETGGPGACPRRGDSAAPQRLQRENPAGAAAAAAIAAGRPGPAAGMPKSRGGRAAPGPPPPLGLAPRCSRWRAPGRLLLLLPALCCLPGAARAAAAGPGDRAARAAEAEAPFAGQVGLPRRAGLRARGFRAGRGAAPGPGARRWRAGGRRLGSGLETQGGGR